MILLIFALFIVGMLAILLEAVLPYGISAILGALMIGFSIYLAYDNYGLALAAFYSFAALVLSILLLRWVLQRGVQAFSLKSPVGFSSRKESPPPPAAAKAKMGDLAVTVQPLRPTGSIEFQETRHNAMYLYPEREIPVGARVRIRGRDSIYYLVEEEPEAATEAAPETAE